MTTILSSRIFWRERPPGHFPMNGYLSTMALFSWSCETVHAATKCLYDDHLPIKTQKHLHNGRFILIEYTNLHKPLETWSPPLLIVFLSWLLIGDSQWATGSRHNSRLNIKKCFSREIISCTSCQSLLYSQTLSNQQGYWQLAHKGEAY